MSEAFSCMLKPSSAALNQTSFPEGAHTTLASAACCGEIVLLRPEESITATVPALSPNTGCSAKATRSPWGEMHTLLI
jgi:hypothetical protein